MRTDQIDRARAKVRDLARSATNSSDYRRGVLDVVDGVVPWDGAVFVEFDPASLLVTAATPMDLDAEQCATAFDIELGQRDNDLYADMAREATGVAVLSRTVGGEMSRSARYRELYRPFGLHDELRAVARSGRACWGGMSLAREPGRDFTDDEASAVSALQDVIADGLRAMLVRAAASAAGSSAAGPAVIMLGPDGVIESGTDKALALLATPDSDHDELGALSVPIHAVASRLRASPNGVARVRLRASDGTWLVLHAASLRSADGPGRTVVTIEPARPPEVVSMVAAIIGLSRRETEVLEYLLAGRSSVEIARRLFVSPYTVDKHVQHVLEKAGVRNRKELISWLFFSHYAHTLDVS